MILGMYTAIIMQEPRYAGPLSGILEWSQAYKVIVWDQSHYTRLVSGVTGIPLLHSASMAGAAILSPIAGMALKSIANGESPLPSSLRSAFLPALSTSVRLQEPAQAGHDIVSVL